MIRDWYRRAARLWGYRGLNSSGLAWTTVCTFVSKTKLKLWKTLNGMKQRLYHPGFSRRTKPIGNTHLSVYQCTHTHINKHLSHWLTLQMFGPMWKSQKSWLLFSPNSRKPQNKRTSDYVLIQEESLEAFQWDTGMWCACWASEEASAAHRQWQQLQMCSSGGVALAYLTGLLLLLLFHLGPNLLNGTAQVQGRSFTPRCCLSYVSSLEKPSHRQMQSALCYL